MSLYDKYHSEYNKKYMYDLIRDLCKKELNINIDDYKEYKDYYEEQYPIIFDKTKSENISDINKELLDKIVSIINIDRSEEKSLKKYIYHSYDREDIINSDFSNFKIIHKDFKKECTISTIIIPENDGNILYPIRSIMINDKEYIYILNDTKIINNINYCCYKNNDILLLKDSIINIKIPNNFSNYSDITEIKNITVNDDYIYLLLNKDDINKNRINDKICLISESKLIKKIYKIRKKEKNFIILDNSGDNLEINEDQLYIINLKMQTQLLIE